MIVSCNKISVLASRWQFCAHFIHLCYFYKCVKTTQLYETGKLLQNANFITYLVLNKQAHGCILLMPKIARPRWFSQFDLL